jgi:hypothetical protein
VLHTHTHLEPLGKRAYRTGAIHHSPVAVGVARSAPPPETGHRTGADGYSRAADKRSSRKLSALGVEEEKRLRLLNEASAFFATIRL